MLGAQRSDVVRLAVVVPGDDLDHRVSPGEDSVPAVKDERSAWEDPVLAVRDLLQNARQSVSVTGCTAVYATGPDLRGRSA